MATRITPTFLLKGIDPFEVLKEYQAGVYNRPVMPKAPIKIAQNTTILAPIYGNNNQCPVFCMKDRNNSSIVIATSNHSNFEVFTSSGGKLPEGGRCDFCKEDFKNTVIGYPVGFREITVLTNSDSSDKVDNSEGAKYRVIYAFWVEGCHCSFECALGCIHMHVNRLSTSRDSMLSDSERYLKLLYRLTYPNAGILKPATDPRLYSLHGKGSLTKEEWSDSKHIYTRSDRVLMIPAKVEYIRSNFETPQLAIDIVNLNNHTIVTPST